jgi:Flp pilus assembly protein TadG
MIRTDTFPEPATRPSRRSFWLLGSGRRRRARGQTLVEFSLVIPISVVLIMGIIEFSLVLDALLAVNFASREAALIGAEAGSAAGADCVILRKIQDSVGAPADNRLITAVRIYKATTAGVDSGTGNNYDRAGTTSCPLPGDPTATVAFRQTANAYPDTARCNYLAGCQGPVRPLDHIGVQITYAYSWHTPLSYLISLAGTGYTIVKANAMRMEPIL